MGQNTEQSPAVGVQPAWPIESPRELITKLVNERDEATQKLDFLKSRGLTVGTMKESGKDPYLMYAIARGSELCDLDTVNKLVDAEVQRDKYASELAACAEIVQKVYLGSNSGIGLLCVAEALREIFAECAGLPELTDEQRAKINAMPAKFPT